MDEEARSDRREREGGRRREKGLGCGMGCGVEGSAERLDRNCDTAWRRLPSEAPPASLPGKACQLAEIFLALLQGTGVPLTRSRWLKLLTDILKRVCGWRRERGATEFEFCKSSAAEQSPKVGGGHSAACHDCLDDGLSPDDFCAGSVEEDCCSGTK